MEEFLINLNENTELIVKAKTKIIPAEYDFPAEVEVKIKEIWVQIDSEEVEFIPTDEEEDFIIDKIVERTLNQ